MEYIGYLGLISLTISWLPQSIETIKQGKSGINIMFLVLVGLGSTCLGIYAMSIGNTVFSILNFISTTGALLNIYYKIFQRNIPV
jgi:uncharacterized protein with PQ loop repeat